MTSIFLTLGVLAFAGIPLAIGVWVAGCFLIEHRADRIPILLYHRLIRKEDADAGRIPDDEMIWVSYDTRFDEQMEWLEREGYETLDMDDYLAIRAGKRPAPPKAVAITFDDGYRSNYTLAFPALKKRGMKATIFVALEPDEHTHELVKGMDGFLDAQEMRELSDNGVNIQSHTLTHCILSELSDDEAWHELTESQRRLSEITGKAVDHIAIPRAGYSRRIRALVEKAGYRSSCCNNKGSSTALSSAMALPRIVIERDMDVAEFGEAFSPTTAATLRIVGGIKRIPERMGGAIFASQVRGLLYSSPFGGLFETRVLKRAVALVGALYVGLSVAFWWRLLS